MDRDECVTEFGFCKSFAVAVFLQLINRYSGNCMLELLPDH